MKPESRFWIFERYERAVDADDRVFIDLGRVVAVEFLTTFPKGGTKDTPRIQAGARISLVSGQQFSVRCTNVDWFRDELGAQKTEHLTD